MKSQVSLLLALILVVAGFTLSVSVNAAADIPAPPAIGATIDEFTLPDLDGKEHSLSSLKGKNGSVLLFISVQCPVSNDYNERMEKLAQEFKAKGINVIGINSNVTESNDAIKSHAAANKLTFPIVKDAGNKIADRLGATKTPEAYFLDASNKLMYHGRIDNSRNSENVNSSELRDAMESLLAGKPIAKPTALAFGCSIKRA